MSDQSKVGTCTRDQAAPVCSAYSSVASSSTAGTPCAFQSAHLLLANNPPALHPYPAVMRVQVGASAHSSLWLYYVPSQAVSGIKLRVLGVGALL